MKDHPVWFGEIELREVEIVIFGWTWSGLVEETIPLNNVPRFKKWTLPNRQNCRLGRDGKPSIRGRIEMGVQLWTSEWEDDERIKLKRRH